MTSEDFSIKPAICPNCGDLLDRAAESVFVDYQRSRRPRPGDYSVCAGCASVARWDECLTLRLATDADMQELSPAERTVIEKMVKLHKICFPHGLHKRRGAAH